AILVLRWPPIGHVSCNTYNFQSPLSGRAIQQRRDAELPADRIGTWPQALGSGLADDRNIRIRFRLLVSEGAATNDRNEKGIEVFRGNKTGIGEELARERLARRHGDSFKTCSEHQGPSGGPRY